MKKRMTLFALSLSLIMSAIFIPSVSPARADVEDRLFDFNDAFYWQNGVDPGRIVNRVNGTPPRSVFDAPIFPNQTNVRVRATNPAYVQSSKHLTAETQRTRRLHREKLCARSVFSVSLR